LFCRPKNAYDYINKNTFWYVLGQQGVLAKLVELLWDLHMGNNATIKAFGGEILAFGVQEWGSIRLQFAPLLFNIFLDFVI
jgi:hypothetical protein